MALPLDDINSNCLLEFQSLALLSFPAVAGITGIQIHVACLYTAEILKTTIITALSICASHGRG